MFIIYQIIAEFKRGVLEYNSEFVGVFQEE